MILSIFYDSLLAISHDWYALSLWALTLIPPPCGLRPRGRNQVRAFRSPFLIWRWYWYMPCVLDLGSCKCINRDVWHQHRDHSFVKSFWQLRYRFWSGDHSLISSSSLHFVGIDTVVVSSKLHQLEKNLSDWRCLVFYVSCEIPISIPRYVPKFLEPLYQVPMR